jgi:hypothetical protein
MRIRRYLLSLCLLVTICFAQNASATQLVFKGQATTAAR